MKLTVGSLFSGIGGLEYGLELTGGFKTIWHCEIDPYASAVLRKHWPDVPNLGDITKVDWATVERPDLICGGFPCQDISVAGKGAGIKAGTRSGLWSEFAKAIRALRPRYALIENVPMLANRGLNIVLADLAEAGYDAEWHNISAASVGAWHKRERIFIIATKSLRCGCDGGTGDRETRHLPHNQERNLEEASERRQSQRQPATGKVGDVPDTISTRTRLEEHRGGGQERQSADTSKSEVLRQENREIGAEGNNPDCTNVPDTDTRRLERTETQGGEWQGHDALRNSGKSDEIPVTNVPDTEQLVARQGGTPDTDTIGIGQQERTRKNIHLEQPKTIEQNIDDFRRENQCGYWKAEPDVGRVANGVPSRVDRIKCLGNAVVPQVAQVVGEIILEMEASL